MTDIDKQFDEKNATNPISKMTYLKVLLTENDYSWDELRNGSIVVYSDKCDCDERIKESVDVEESLKHWGYGEVKEGGNVLKEENLAKSLELMLNEFLESDDDIRWIISQRWFNDLSQTIPNIYSQAKAEQREEDALIAEGKKINDQRPKLLIPENSKSRYGSTMYDAACDSIASEIRGQQ